jgi:plastocyanin
MRVIIIPVIFLLISILSYNELNTNAQETDFTLTINPGATNSDSQNPIAPANITVPIGTTVTWLNKDATPHFIISGTPDEGSNNTFYGDYFATDENYTVTMDNPGVYDYYDPAYTHIKGQITVEDVAFPSELGSSANDSSADGIVGSFVQDSPTTPMNDFKRYL